MGRRSPRFILLAALMSASVFAQAKLTPRRSEANRVALQLTMKSPARTELEMDSKLILDKDFQSCLRRALRENNSADFALIVQGRIGEDGKLEVNALRSLSGPEFESCVRGVLGSVQFSAGRSGPFELRLERAQSQGSPSKTLILDLSPTKIYQ